MFCNITFSKSPSTIAWWLAMTSCKEYPFSIHIEILLMMTQNNKVFSILILFSTAVREIEDLIHNLRVFFKVINRDCLYLISKICIVVRRIVLNISITVNKIYNERVLRAVFFLQWVLTTILFKFPILCSDWRH